MVSPAAVVAAVSWRMFCCGGFVRQGVGRRSLSVAAYWRVLRTLGGKNIGKCRLRAHQHPLCRHCRTNVHTITSTLPPTYLQSDSSNERVLKMACCVHRFLISRPDLRIDARFCLFTPSCVHRFLISGPDLGIDASFSPFTPSCVHRFLISRPDLRIDARFCLFIPSCVHRFLISGPDLGIAAEFSTETPSIVQ